MRVKLSVSNSVLDFFLIFAQFGDKLIQGLFEIFKDFCSYVQLRKKEKRLASNIVSNIALFYPTPLLEIFSFFSNLLLHNQNNWWLGLGHLKWLLETCLIIPIPIIASFDCVQGVLDYRDKGVQKFQKIPIIEFSGSLQIS